MKKPIGILLLAVVVQILGFSQAGAQEPSAGESKNGVYLAGQGGFTTFELEDGDIGGGNNIDSTQVVGFSVGGALGFKLGNFRLEGEIGYREYDPSDLEIAGVELDITGDLTVLSYLANLYFDFDNSTRFTPYIGGGVGAAKFSANNLVRGGILNVDEEDTVFAYKVGGGLAFTMTPSLDLTFDYHYFGTAEPEFTNSLTGARFNPDYHSHNIQGGLRFRF